MFRYDFMIPEHLDVEENCGLFNILTNRSLDSDYQDIARDFSVYEFLFCEDYEQRKTLYEIVFELFYSNMKLLLEKNMELDLRYETLYKMMTTYLETKEQYDAIEIKLDELDKEKAFLLDEIIDSLEEMTDRILRRCEEAINEIDDYQKKKKDLI